MKEDNVKNEYITKKDLENLLGEQTQTILSAMDQRLEKSENNLRTEMYAIRTELKEDIQGIETKLEKKIDEVNISVDGYVKAQEDFKQEFTIMQEEGKQMKNAFKEKLGLEIRAI